MRSASAAPYVSGITTGRPLDEGAPVVVAL